VCGSSAQLASVLEAGMLPSNTFTRRSGDARGQSLYFPGVLRAAATDWTYRKIFAAKNKGGRREHSVSAPLAGRQLLLQCLTGRQLLLRTGPVVGSHAQAALASVPDRQAALASHKDSGRQAVILQ
jgi:hypothetical protein